MKASGKNGNRLLFYISAVCYGVLIYRFSASGASSAITDAPMGAFWWKYLIFAAAVMAAAELITMLLCGLRIHKSADALAGWSYSDGDIMELNGYGRLRKTGYNIIKAGIEGRIAAPLGAFAEKMREARTSDAETSPLYKFITEADADGTLLNEPALTGAYVYVKKLFERVDGIVYGVYTAAFMIAFMPGLVRLLSGAGGLGWLIATIVLGVGAICFAGYFFFFVITGTCKKKTVEIIMAEARKKAAELTGNEKLLRDYCMYRELPDADAGVRELMSEISTSENEDRG